VVQINSDDEENIESNEENQSNSKKRNFSNNNNNNNNKSSKDFSDKLSYEPSFPTSNITKTIGSNITNNRKSNSNNNNDINYREPQTNQSTYNNNNFINNNNNNNNQLQDLVYQNKTKEYKKDNNNNNNNNRLSSNDINNNRLSNNDINNNRLSNNDINNNRLSNNDINNNSSEQEKINDDLSSNEESRKGKKGRFNQNPMERISEVEGEDDKYTTIFDKINEEVAKKDYRINENNYQELINKNITSENVKYLFNPTLFDTEESKHKFQPEINKNSKFILSEKERNKSSDTQRTKPQPIEVIKKFKL